MHFTFSTLAATFLERPNRYVIHARLHESGKVVRAHCPDPGRLQELLIPGAVVHVDLAAPGAVERRTTHTLRFVEHPENGQLVSLNTQLPNAVFAEGLAHGFFPQFTRYTKREKEVTLLGEDGTRSRIDFRLRDDEDNVCWVEVKSASLVIDGTALFPDAPTVRGRRHVDELAHRVGLGEAAAVVFVVQRPDAHGFAPYAERDPAFAASLRGAADQGVAVYAYTCLLSTHAIQLDRSIPVQLEGKHGD